MPARVTVVVVQRERFGISFATMENLYQVTPQPFEVIYVDGGSPAAARRRLQEEAQRRGFRVIRSEYYLAGNEARNLALMHVDTEYVVFLDNDAYPAPGWLDALVRCADETGAMLVGPLYCIGEPLHDIIHQAGGACHIEEIDGRRTVIEKNRHAGLHRRDLRLERGPTELVEYHCMLARTEALRRLGPLDEAYLSAAEHLDLCLTVRQAGGRIMLEPAACITYVPPRQLAWNERPFFIMRWSDAWNRASLEHFRRKWQLDAGDPFLHDHHLMCSTHRLVGYPGWTSLMGAMRPEARAWIERHLVVPVETHLNRRLIQNTRHTWRDRATGKDRPKLTAN